MTTIQKVNKIGLLTVFLLLMITIASKAQLVQQGSKLVGTGNVGGAQQGISVSLSADGNTAIVGGPSDNGGQGAAWVYTRSGSTWSQQGGKLVGTNSSSSSYQGSSVALSADGNTAIVGGWLDNGALGAAWVFTRSGSSWSQQGDKLVGTGNTGPAAQGFSVSLSADGNTAMVGGWSDNSQQGAAWVFTRSGSSWSQQGDKLVGTGNTSAAWQGYSVSLSADGNTAMVGGYNDNSGQGAAWVYTRSGSTWTQQGGKLVGTGNVGGALQGISVSLSADGNTAMVGGPSDNGGLGAAWLYTRSGSTWSQQGVKLEGTGNVGNSQQGISVSLSADGNTAIVGGVTDDGGLGAAWVFTRNGSSWSQQGGKLVGTGSVGIVNQGWSVALSADGNTAIVGGRLDNSEQGAAWVYSVASTTISSFFPTSAATGQTVTITGTNFTGATAVSFGGTAATSFSVVNDATITAVVGSGSSGSVSVTTPGGTASLAGFVFCVGLASTVTWTGIDNNNWFNKNNWCPNKVPNSTSDVSIPVTARNPVITGSVNAFVDNLNIASGASITVTNVTLNVARTITGTGTISGKGLTLANNGPIGTLYFGVAGIEGLKLTGTGASATLGNATNVFGELNVGSATLNTGGNLTLKSNINGTAWVAPLTGGSITGNVTVERYIPANAFRAWRMLSVPVQGSQTFRQAWQENNAPMANGTPGFGTLLTNTTGTNGYDAATTGNSLLSFTNGTPGAFTQVSNTNNAMQTTSGYFVYIRGNRSTAPSGGVFGTTATTLRTNGTLYTGTQPLITLPAGQNVMVGNVYASAIDFSLLPGGNTSYKVWDPKIAGTNNVGGYQTYSTVAGQYVPGGGSYPSVPTIGRIESGQAFIVSSVGASSIQLVEAAKVTGSRNVFRPSSPIQILKANIYAVTKGENKLADGIAIVLDNSFSNDIDNNDVLKTPNTGENVGIVNGTSIMTVEARRPFVASDKVAFSVSNLKQSEYQFEFNPSNIINPANVNAVLKDNFLGTELPVSLENPTMINFTVTDNAKSAASDRFTLLFKPSGVTLPELTSKDRSIHIYPTLVTEKTVNVQLVNQQAGKYTVRIINSLGQLVQSQFITKGAGTTNHQILLLASKTHAGVYQVEVISPDKKRKVEKVVISNN